MALNSTPRRRFGVGLGVVLASVSAGMIGFVGTASAHTDKSVAECVAEAGKATLTVDLRDYNDREQNTVKVTDNDEVIHEGTFGSKFKQTFEAAGDVAHTFTVKVVAWDDKNGHNGWSFTEEHKTIACVEQPPVETTTTTTTTTPPETTTTTVEVPPSETSSEAPPVSTTTVAPTTTAEVQEEALAETGASIALPLGIAGVLIVGGVVALFVVRRRSKA